MGVRFQNLISSILLSIHVSGTNDGKSQQGEGIAPEIVVFPRVNTGEGCGFPPFDDTENKFEKVLVTKFHILFLKFWC